MLPLAVLAAPRSAIAQACQAGWIPERGTGGVGPVLALAVLPGGDLIVGGTFSPSATIPGNIARYCPTTGTWSTLGTGVSNSGGTSPAVLALAVLPNGDFIAGGDLTTAGGAPASYVARYSPTSNTWSPLGSGVGSYVFALAVLPDGDLVVGGNFSNAGGLPARNIARYSPATSTWSPLGGGTAGVVEALAVAPNGDLFVGGLFTSAGGGAAESVVRYNPQTGVWSALGLLTNGAVKSLAALPDGGVIAGGSFSLPEVPPYTVNVARYSPTTSTWSPAGSGVGGVVRTLTPLPGGDVIAGGNFLFAGGTRVNHVARYHPMTDTWSALGAGTGSSVGNNVYSSAALPNGDVMVGGYFTLGGGSAAPFLARYHFGAPCPPDFDCSGGLTIGDVVTFLNAWLASDPRADFNGVGGQTTQDIFDFLNAWFAGCP